MHCLPSGTRNTKLQAPALEPDCLDLTLPCCTAGACMAWSEHLTSWCFPAAYENEAVISPIAQAVRVNECSVQQCLAHRACLGSFIAINIYHVPDAENE